MRMRPESTQEDAKMAAGRARTTNRIIYVICTFHRGEEGFNGIGSIKTDLYYGLGWVCLAASSILRYGDRISTKPHARDISKQTTGTGQTSF